MEDTDNVAWVFDSLVGFLHGPVWNAPLQSFIEEKSLTFEPTENGEIRDTPEYRDIYEQYKNLVDIMLGSFMEDIGITPEQFEDACRASRAALGGLQRRLFQQVWAANDYRMFVRLMTHKNVELQLQALELIEWRFGALPEVFQHNEEAVAQDASADWNGDDAAIMKEIEKLDDNENDAEVPGVRKPDTPIPFKEAENIEAEKTVLKNTLHKFEKKLSADNVKMKQVSFGGDEIIVEAEVVYSGPEETDVKDYAVTRNSEISESDLKERAEYLKRQRDRLVAMKRQIRGRQLAASDAGGSRPRSARAARAALAGAPDRAADPALELRRALVDRLKTEVIQGN